MSVGEGDPEAQISFDWEYPHDFILEGALREIWKRFQRLETGDPELANKWLAGDSLTLTTPLEGNDVAINFLSLQEKSRRHPQIGYYSPADGGEFIFYPELVDTDDEIVTETLRQEAFAKRLESIVAFNKRTGAHESRIDYSDLAVEELHKAHHSFLDNTGFIFKVLERFNYKRIKLEPPEGQLEIDQLTRGAICLVRHQKAGVTKEDYFIGLRLRGALRHQAGTMVRQRLNVIHLAELDSSLDEPMHYKRVDDVIEPDDVEILVERAEEVMELGNSLDLDGFKFDRNQLGIIMPPFSA